MNEELEDAILFLKRFNRALVLDCWTYAYRLDGFSRFRNPGTWRFYIYKKKGRWLLHTHAQDQL